MTIQNMVNTSDGTDQPMAKWIENVEQVFPLHLRGGTLAVYHQLIKEQKANIKQFKHALLTAFMIDLFVTFDQFIVPWLKILFLAELKKLTILSGKLPEQCLVCAFVLELLSHIRQALWASFRMDNMTLN